MNGLNDATSDRRLVSAEHPGALKDLLTRVLKGESDLRLDADTAPVPGEAELVNTLLDRYGDAVFRRELYVQALSDMVRRFESAVAILSLVKRLTELASNEETSSEMLCQGAARVIVEEAGVENCSIMLIHPSEDMLTLAAAFGQGDRLYHLDDDPPSRNHMLRFQRGEGIAGHVAQSGQPYLCADVGSDPLFTRVKGRAMRGAIYCLPLISHDRLLGVLNVSDVSTERFGEPEQRAFQLVGEVLAQLMTLCVKRRLLRESEAFHRGLVENAGDVMLTTDMGLVLTSLNRTGREIFALESSQVPGVHLLSQAVPEDEQDLRDCVHRLIYGKPLGCVRIRFRAGESGITALDCSFRLIVDDDWPMGIEIIGRHAHEAQPAGLAAGAAG